MNRKRFKAEEIVNKLREADVLLSKGQTVAQACKQIGVTGFTYYRWRREYGARNQLCWIFRELGASRGWYLHGMFG